MSDHNEPNNLDINTILETTRLLIEPNDAEFVQNNLLLILMGKLLVNKAAIFIHSPISNRYKVVKQKGVRTLADREFTLDFISDVNDPICDIEHAGLEVAEEIKMSGLNYFIPLKTSELHLGYLSLGKKMNRLEFSSNEMKLLLSVSSIASIGIANSRLLTELKKTNKQLDKKVQELHTLFDISQEFSGTLEQKQIVRIFKFALLGQMLVQRFFFIYQRGDERTLVAKNGIKDEPNAEDFKAFFKLDDDLTIVDDTLRSKIPCLKHCGIHTIIALRLGGQKMAVIGVGPRASGEELSSSDFNFLSSLGNLALLSFQKNYLIEERLQRKNLEQEIQLAKTIQDGLLPNRLPTKKGIDLAAINIPSKEVGGDYYDVLERDGKLILSIADVTGKGIPAALLMANMQSMLHALTYDEFDMSNVTDRINEIMYRNTPNDKFITFFWATLDTQTNELQFVNAGHNPPYIIGKDGSVSELKDGGLLIGAMPTLSPYVSTKCKLNQGDVLVMFTDGVTEAENDEGDMFEEERLIECVQNNINESAQTILDAISVDVKKFTGGSFNDDFTALIVKIT